MMFNRTTSIVATVLLLGVLGLFSLGAQDLYWEDPEYLVSSGALFSQTVSNDNIMVNLWQEVVNEGDSSSVYLSLTTSENGSDWEENRRFLGPYPFTGEEIPFYNAILTESGALHVAVSETDTKIHIYESLDGGRTLNHLSQTDTVNVRVMPRYSQTADGGFLLFATQSQATGVANSLGVSFSHSDTGEAWTEFVPLNTEAGVRGTFLPSHVSHNGREYVFYQAFNLSTISTFQLFLKISDDGGRSWGGAIYLSGFSDPLDGIGDDPYQYDNQRPSPAVVNGILTLTWERSLAGQQSQIFYVELNDQGQFSGSASRVSRGRDICRNPRILGINGETYVLWFDNRTGDNHLILARKDGVFWESYDMTLLMGGNSQFGSFIPFGEQVYLLWENEYEDRSRLVVLAPDNSVTSPVLRGSDFVVERPKNTDSFTVRWNSPADSSGIAGYSYTYSRETVGTPPKRLMTLDRDRVFKVEANDDGLWYFHIAAQDYAGNWSETSSIAMYRDTTPPEQVTFLEPELDEDGYLTSNTGTLEWLPPVDDPFITGYTWRFQYLSYGSYAGDPESFNLRSPPYETLGDQGAAKFYNRDNGFWAITVRSIDIAGNYGDPGSLFFRMNKYIPVTYISSVSTEEDALGAYTLSLRGRGFSVGGEISEIVLDLDKKAPYDIVITEDTGLYSVESDRLIDGPIIEDVATADYWVGVVHPTRGLKFAPRKLSLTALGTVKFGDFNARPGLGLIPARKSRYSFSFAALLIVLVTLFLAAMILLTIRRITVVVSEGQTLERQARALITGEGWTLEEQNAKIEENKRMRTGVRFKITVLVTLLVLLVVAMVSIPLAYLTNRNQEEILAQGLAQRTEVLLESLTSGARTYLPAKNILELGNLPGQMSALGSDALFVTVTGEAGTEAGAFDGVEWVWATNDEDLLNGERLTPGGILLEDDLTPGISTLTANLNQEASTRVDEISQEILELNEKVEPLVAAYIRSQDPEAEAAINEIQDQLRLLDTTLNNRLLEIGNVVYSEPAYDATSLSRKNTRYVFYKPIMYRQEGQDIYYRGTIRLGISTEAILKDIQANQRQLFIIIGIIAIIALVLGFLGSFLLAAIIIRPIRILSRGVEFIRDAEDIAKDLEDHTIDTHTRDELSELAKTVNQMTHRLVVAAKAGQMLTMGKDVQKQYISLDLIPGSQTKGTTIEMENDDVALFGYYEGALGVSGDLFNYDKIDQDHIAFIKGDVSGKGVPAALIMVQVSTLFTNFFRNWTVKNDERLRQGKKNLAIPDITILVDQTNDLLDAIGAGVAGKFAAFIVGVLNIKTGRCELCHAGDNLLHIFDHETGMMTRKLPERPAAGSFPSDLVKMQMGYSKDIQVLKSGDIMFLYTDGIEEAQRHFRDSDFNIRICEETAPDDVPEDERENWFHGDKVNGMHPPGENFEELGNTRIHAIVNAVLAQGSYSLYKYHHAIPDEPLTFDFSTCQGIFQEAVIALLAMDRIWRFYPDPSAGSKDEIRIDKKIDEFLKKHFDQYDTYFNNPIVNKKGVSEEDNKVYNYYTHIKEDHQFDDLTVLGIMKK